MILQIFAYLIVSLAEISSWLQDNNGSFWGPAIRQCLRHATKVVQARGGWFRPAGEVNRDHQSELLRYPGAPGLNKSGLILTPRPGPRGTAMQPSTIFTSRSIISL